MKNGFIQNQFGGKIWYKDDQVHRLNGPAQIWHDNRTFSINNIPHRLNGPARIYAGINKKYWYIWGNEITYQVYSYCHYNNIDIHNYQNLKLSDKLKLKFEFGLQL